MTKQVTEVKVIVVLPETKARFIELFRTLRARARRPGDVTQDDVEVLLLNTYNLYMATQAASERPEMGQE